MDVKKDVGAHVLFATNIRLKKFSWLTNL